MLFELNNVKTSALIFFTLHVTVMQQRAQFVTRWSQNW